MDSNHPSVEAPDEADDDLQGEAAASRKDQLTRVVVRGILDGAELPLEEIPSFIEAVNNALNQLKQQVVERAESEIARVEALRAKVRGVEPRTMPEDSGKGDLDGGEVAAGTIENAHSIVEHMEEENLKGIRRKDVVNALRMTDVHASQALAFAVKQGWLKLEGQTRGAKYFLTGSYREEDYFALRRKA